ncbi:MAG: deoxyribodipyrimidine photo-lyase [Desulfobacteraceae bacterium]|nr:deoxyribodipyrimidine photo-lyase [Desulfobacteraceae bacterium]
MIIDFFLPSKTMIHKDRMRHLIAAPPENGKYVLYWMQQAQRVAYNHALCHAVEIASELVLPLVAGVVLTPDFPEAGLRHYVFMLEGLADVQKDLKERGIPFVIKTGPMVETVLTLAGKAAWVVTDVGYLRIQRQWREQVARGVKCPYTEIETDVIVPVSAASSKEESAARTLRPRIMKQLDAHLDPVLMPEYRMKNAFPPMPLSGSIDPLKLAEQVAVENIPPVKIFHGGYAEAKARLNRFISEKLADYDTLARDPAARCQSDLSPYLHFGQISAVEIVREVRASSAPDAARTAFIEQVAVRRELAVNFVFYNPGYDQYESAVPSWAKQTLSGHQKDRRPHLYSVDVFEQAKTHDPYWNAAQIEMVATGKMHNYMRMYWGKKIIEWTRTPEEAFEIMRMLNNRYELDGRDANGFAGVAWCFGRHDRPWGERPVFGKVRYMNAAGLNRKFAINEYVSRVSALQC